MASSPQSTRAPRRSTSAGRRSTVGSTAGGLHGPSPLGPLASPTPSSSSSPRGSIVSSPGADGLDGPAMDRRGSSSGGEGVVVVVRFRPLSRAESAKNHLKLAVSEDERTVTLTLPRSHLPASSPGQPEHTFTVDHVLGAGEASMAYEPASSAAGADTDDADAGAPARGTFSNAQAHTRFGQPAVDSVMQGYNACIFAYGQTGSGKTHTLLGPDVFDVMGAERGIVPRACHDLVAAVGATPATVVKEFLVRCTYLEVYNEQVNDLLNAAKKNLKVRESKALGVFVEDITEESVASAEDMLDLLELGARSRATASTKSNERSSRSHCIFTVFVEARLPDGSVRRSAMNMVDLAGSETVKKTGATGTTLKEATKINASLTALGKCIKALTDARATHVPFRDSKLTRLLKDSLGGNTKTTLIACCSAHHSSFEETLSTMRFAQRAKALKTQASVNVSLSPDVMQRMIADLKREVASLREENVRLGGVGVGAALPVAMSAGAGGDTPEAGEDGDDGGEPGASGGDSSGGGAAAPAAVSDEVGALRERLLAAERRASEQEEACERLKATNKHLEGELAAATAARTGAGGGGGRGASGTGGGAAAQLATAVGGQGSVLAEMRRQRGGDVDESGDVAADSSSGGGSRGGGESGGAVASRRRRGSSTAAAEPVDMESVKLQLSLWGIRAVTALEDSVAHGERAPVAVKLSPRERNRRAAEAMAAGIPLHRTWM